MDIVVDDTPARPSGNLLRVEARGLVSKMINVKLMAYLVVSHLAP